MKTFEKQFNIKTKIETLDLYVRSILNKHDPYAVEAAGASLLNQEPTFKNKIDEDIWRLKNKK